MFGLELAAVFLREGFPAFGWRDIWREPGHPVRLAFDFGFDFTGVMVLAGCLLALVWRVRVQGTPEQKFSDTPTTLFLLFVVLTGFVVEGLRLAPALGDGAATASFAGVAFAHALRGAGLASPAPYESLWLVHALAALAFIAYVPLRRLVHTCATPIGRLMNSQKALLANKKRGVLGAMLLGRVPRAAPPPQSIPPATDGGKPTHGARPWKTSSRSTAGRVPSRARWRRSFRASPASSSPTAARRPRPRRR